MMIREAIILAGGLGTRLRSVVSDLPKCMAPVAGKPFLYYVLNYYRQQGIERFILSLGYKHNLIEKYIGDHFLSQDLKIVFSVESEPLGTGGAVKLACRQTTEKNVLVINGDTFFSISVKDLSAFHYQHEVDCSLSLKHMDSADRYGLVQLNGDDSIKGFEEKKPHSSGLINGGVYALQVVGFAGEKFPEIFSFEKDYLEKLYSARRMFGFSQDKYFIDIGLPEDYNKAQKKLPENT